MNIIYLCINSSCSESTKGLDKNSFAFQKLLIYYICTFFKCLVTCDNLDKNIINITASVFESETSVLWFSLWLLTWKGVVAKRQNSKIIQRNIIMMLWKKRCKKLQCPRTQIIENVRRQVIIWIKGYNKNIFWNLMPNVKWKEIRLLNDCDS